MKMEAKMKTTTEKLHQIHYPGPRVEQRVREAAAKAGLTVKAFKELRQRKESLFGKRVHRRGWCSL